jgi:hypothetical protein
MAAREQLKTREDPARALPTLSRAGSVEGVEEAVATVLYSFLARRRAVIAIYDTIVFLSKGEGHHADVIGNSLAPSPRIAAGKRRRRSGARERPCA